LAALDNQDSVWATAGTVVPRETVAAEFRSDMKEPAPSASERAAPSPVMLVTALQAAETLMTFHLQQVVQTTGKRQVYHIDTLPSAISDRCAAVAAALIFEGLVAKATSAILSQRTHVRSGLGRHASSVLAGVRELARLPRHEPVTPLKPITKNYRSVNLSLRPLAP
jgi:hypothetical protein